MSSTRDEIIRQLNKEIDQLEHELERINAVNECANLMNKYQIYHCKGMTVEETHLFALKSPGGCVEMLWGIHDEPEGILAWKRCEGYGKPQRAIPFISMGHGMTTPIIEVSKDGQTAKGLWIMFGSEASRWASAQFAMDFIKEDGKWKIWKYTTTGLFCSPYDKGWIKENRIADMAKGRPEIFESPDRPDRPAGDVWWWEPDSVFQNIPPVPLPFETWEDSLACIPSPEET